MPGRNNNDPAKNDDIALLGMCGVGFLAGGVVLVFLAGWSRALPLLAAILAWGAAISLALEFWMRVLTRNVERLVSWHAALRVAGVTATCLFIDADSTVWLMLTGFMLGSLPAALVVLRSAACWIWRRTRKGPRG